MDKAVANTHCLLGSRLRDPDSGRQGCIVGIDQTRETPALLINWSETGVQRVTLGVSELADLVAASLEHERTARGDKAARDRQASPSSRGASTHTRREPRARDERGAEPSSAACDESLDAGVYPPLATGSGGGR